MLSFFAKHKAAQAKIVRRNETTCLLAVLNSSSPPIIWQFDLAKMPNYTLTLREKDGEWDLGLLLPQGTFNVIAHFDERSDAEEAYAAIRRALICEANGSHRVRRFLTLLIVFVLGLLTAQLFMSTPLPSGAELAQKVLSNEAPEHQGAGPKELRPGVPMSADDVLTPPAE